MNYHQRLFSLISFFTLSLFCGYSQTLDNATAFFDGERMVITFDLTHLEASQKFKIILYSSHDNYINPIAISSGDVGEEVLPGKSKKVVWDVKKELPENFDDEISIKIKAVRMAAPITKLTFRPLGKKGYKKGSTIDLQWQGGEADDKINITLLKDGAVQQKLAENVSNTKSYKWAVPEELKGKGYSIRIADDTNQSNSGVFTIKPKVSRLLFIAPVVVIGLVLALKPPPNNDLPGPVKPE